MKWHTVMSGLFGVLLPLPLLGLLYLAMSGSVQPLPLPQGKTLIPMLSLQERLRLRTYEQECGTDADCEPSLRCFYNLRTDRQYCTDSTCMTDADCPRDFACRTLWAYNSDDLVRTCSLVGIRKEGELCEALPLVLEDGCGKGLLCSGFCGRSCRLDEPASCPEGYRCKEGNDGPSCVPTCQERACPDGQRCVELMAGHGSICMTVHGQDCKSNPCPDGLRCSISASPRSPDDIWMQCLRGCGGKDDSPCPDGSVCYLFQCRKACDPEGPQVCEPGFACGRNHDSMPWACLPD